MTRILAINGSYRVDGITDQALELMKTALEKRGVEVETLALRDFPIQFCLNCRECALHPGEQPGQCVQRDGMDELVSRIERADGFILASPTNFGTVTAQFKRFMERLTVYAYWPWGQAAPKYRKADAARKKAVLISSCAAPGVLGRLFYDTRRQLRTTAKTIGADSVGMLFTGLIATGPEARLPAAAHRKINKLADKLAA